MFLLFRKKHDKNKPASGAMTPYTWIKRYLKARREREQAELERYNKYMQYVKDLLEYDMD